jgi:hypothetical protein
VRLAQDQAEKHTRFLRDIEASTRDDDRVAAAAASPASAEVATETPFGLQLALMMRQIEALPTGRFQVEAREVVQSIALDTFFAVEAEVQAVARTALPISARAQVEDWLAGFAERFTGGFENGVISGLHSIDSVQEKNKRHPFFQRS